MLLLSVLPLATAVLATAGTPFDKESFLSGLAESPTLVDHRPDSARDLAKPSDTCPPCFNCNLPNFSCKQFSQCNNFTGRCECNDGFGSDDCSEPVCGGLSDGANRPVRDPDTKCKCSKGWSGINCNMCTEDKVCNSFVPEGLEGTCYQGGILVHEFHQVCEVTNKKILEVLNGKIPEVTFTCNKTSAECSFQFWVDEDESFYCDLTKCDYQYNLDKNSTDYTCAKAACQCLPDKMLCGKGGSIDISDFLTETIKGPGEFSCDLESQNCKFSEPSMNDLITNVFGDPYITLDCLSGECLHSSEIPGYHIPPKEKLGLIDILKIAGALAGCFIVIGMVMWQAKNSPLFATSGVKLPEDEDDGDGYLMKNYKPATFSFEKVNYSIGGKEILSDSFGIVRPGEVMAIMGSSGAGKTTLLDILAGKNKSGQKSGDLYVNGEKIVSTDDMKHFKRACGFVDQEDILIPTLTVYETVLNSALLRLPSKMPTETKKARVLQILSELRILDIKDKLIGSDFDRGISGGEKRRVAIACELVTSPSILFLDEPTTGLDGFNAFKVVESLVGLAKDFNRTIIFSIHQPRSNIVALFDKLVLLSQGEIVYSGSMSRSSEYFGDRGYQCPIGYNIADYLIDITSDETEPAPANMIEEPISTVADSYLLEPTMPSTHELSTDADPTSEWAHYASHRDELQRTLSSQDTRKPQGDLASMFANSTVAEQLHSDIQLLSTNYRTSHSVNGGTRDDSFFKPDPSRAKAGFFTQLAILCSRTFKNSYRNPKLLTGHYVLAITAGLFCSYLYYDVANDISGFQNRLGLFFFVLTMFGFSTLTGLHSFSTERIVFVRERSNGYYSSLSYYLSKLICDVIPLRLLPPVIFMAIIYPLVGLNMEGHKFWISILILVLFNMSTSIEILCVGVLIKDPGSATMVGVLIMLFSLLFAGLFINKDTIPVALAWFENVSVFHYGYEALSVNEVNGLVLKEKKYGLDIKVPGAVILSTFGFDVDAVFYDIYWLSGMLGAFTVLGYIFLYYFVYETR